MLNQWYLRDPQDTTSLLWITAMIAMHCGDASFQQVLELIVRKMMKPTENFTEMQSRRGHLNQLVYPCFYRQKPASSWSVKGTLSAHVCHYTPFDVSHHKDIFLCTLAWPQKKTFLGNLLLCNMVLCHKCPGLPSPVATNQVLLSLTGLISQQGHRECDKQTGKTEK